MKLAVTIDEAIAVEEKFSSCYEHLSHVAEDGQSAELRILAREEKNHASVLKTGKNFVFRAPDLFGQEKTSDLEIRLGLKTAQDLQADLMAGKADFRQGLRRIHDLERKFERVHMSTASEIKDFSLKKLFEALARADAEHRQRLERMMARL
jgi:rubrerythrin